MAGQCPPTQSENADNSRRAEEAKAKLLSFFDGLLAVSESLATDELLQNVNPMDVLISWSKKQSREMASVFHGWLPKVVPGLRPWMSNKDIDKGKQWFAELQDFLGEATSCVICVTSENVRSPWIYYETGAIAAKKQEVLVCP